MKGKTNREDRFSTPPPMGASDPKDYPKGLKPGDEGFIEALAEQRGFKYTKKA